MFAHTTVRGLYKFALGLFLLAVACWVRYWPANHIVLGVCVTHGCPTAVQLVDLKLCAHMQAAPFNPQLHGVWHVLVSLSCHSVFIWVVYVEALIAKRDPRVLRPLGSCSPLLFVDPGPVV